MPMANNFVYIFNDAKANTKVSHLVPNWKLDENGPRVRNRNDLTLYKCNTNFK
jgi:hypothetical protein